MRPGLTGRTVKSFSCTVTLSVDMVDILLTWVGVNGGPGVYILDLLLALEQFSMSPEVFRPSMTILGGMEASPCALKKKTIEMLKASLIGLSCLELVS